MCLDDHKLERPLWSFANIDATQFAGLPVEFSMTDKLVDIRKQMLRRKDSQVSPMFQEMCKRRCVPIRLKGSLA